MVNATTVSSPDPDEASDACAVPTLGTDGKWSTSFSAVDFSHPSKIPFLINHKLVELADGEHFDMLMRLFDEDTRPNTLVAFWNSSNEECSNEFRTFSFENINVAERNQLALAFHDMSPLTNRTWYVPTPEMNLPDRFKVQTCPEFVFVSRHCDGMTKWCVGEELEPGLNKIGCDDFTTSCEQWRKFSLRESEGLSLKAWAKQLQQRFGSPPTTVNYYTYQERTQFTTIRNHFLPPAVPKFSSEGIKIMKIPEKMYSALLDFQAKWKHTRYQEDAVFGVIKGAKTFMVPLTRDPQFKRRISDEFVKPILEEWTHLSLKLTSFYGIREYQKGSALRMHLDRETTHVISATMNLGPRDGESEWPIEVITFNGIRLRYNHPPGTMVCYESASVIHGRPYPLPHTAPHSHFGAFIHYSPNPSWQSESMLHRYIEENTISHLLR